MKATKEKHESHSQALEVWKRFRRNKLAMVGMCIAILLVLVSVLAPVLTPYSPSAIDPVNRLQFPTLAHPFGTDDYGRDLLTRVLYGGRISLLISLLSLCFSILLGVGLGATAGYFGGLYEAIVMRCCDILMCIPALLLAVCISSLLGVGIVNTAVAIALAGVAPCIRMMRATVLQIRGQEFVEAARATGSGNLRIIFKQILPNTLSQVIVDATLRVGGNILQISGLSFIGLGVVPPTAEWGSIMSVGRDYITTFWPMVTIPGIFVVLTVFAFNVMGDGLRDALDPRLKQ